MKGWPVVTLAEACSKIQDGAHRSPQILYPAPGPDRFLYLTSKNVRTGRLKLDKVEYCEADFHNEIYPRCNPEPGDLLLTKDGANTGNVAINTLDEPFSLLSSVCLLKPYPTKLLSAFLFYYLQSKEGHAQITGGMTGAAIKRIILRTIKSSRIPLPPLPEQERIVAILDEAFAAIATATANTEKNLGNARELFESYLFRVSEESKSYPHRLLSDIATDFNRGRSRHRPRNAPHLYGGAYPFIQTGDIRHSNHWIADHSQTYSEAGLDQSKLWPAGTVCITIAANIAESGILTFDACFPDSVIGVVVDEHQMSNQYLEYILQAHKTRLQAEGQGAAQDNINLGTFQEQRFPVPPLEEQERYVDLLDRVRDGVAKLGATFAAKAAHLADLKQSILHKAFTGELTADFKAVDRTLSGAGV